VQDLAHKREKAGKKERLWVSSSDSDGFSSGVEIGEKIVKESKGEASERPVAELPVQQVPEHLIVAKVPVAFAIPAIATPSRVDILSASVKLCDGRGRVDEPSRRKLSCPVSIGPSLLDPDWSATWKNCHKRHCGLQLAIKMRRPGDRKKRSEQVLVSLLDKPGWYSVADVLFFQASIFLEPGMRSSVPKFEDASTPVQTLPGIDMTATSPLKELARHTKPTVEGSGGRKSESTTRSAKKVRLVPDNERTGTGKRRSEFLRRRVLNNSRELHPPPEFDCSVHTLPSSELDDFSIALDGSEGARQLLRNTLTNAYFDSSFQAPIKNQPRRPPRLAPNLADLQFRERQAASCAALNMRWMDHAASSDDYINPAWRASTSQPRPTNREQEQDSRTRTHKSRTRAYDSRARTHDARAPSQG
jgi:hypothetical protein